MGSSAIAQNPCGNDEICVVQFNAGFNEANKVDWVEQARFQANIMMQMEATKKEVQNKIDEIIMESF
jgi:hypothetical protein